MEVVVSVKRASVSVISISCLPFQFAFLSDSLLIVALEAIIVSCLYSKAIKGVIPEASDILQVL